MTGLLSLFAAAIWLLIVVAVARFVSFLLPRNGWRWPVVLTVCAVMIVLPVLDEIIGRRQFAALCEANSGFDVDRDRAAGKTVFEAPAEFTQTGDTLLPVYSRPSDFIDAETGERVLGFREFAAHGGWLSAVLRFSDSRGPLTFDGWCNPGGQGRLAALFKELNITLVRRPEQAGAKG